MQKLEEQQTNPATRWHLCIVRANIWDTILKMCSNKMTLYFFFVPTPTAAEEILNRTRNFINYSNFCLGKFSERHRQQENNVVKERQSSLVSANFGVSFYCCPSATHVLLFKGCLSVLVLSTTNCHPVCNKLGIGLAKAAKSQSFTKSWGLEYDGPYFGFAELRYQMLFFNSHRSIVI